MLPNVNATAETTGKDPFQPGLSIQEPRILGLNQSSVNNAHL